MTEIEAQNLQRSLKPRIERGVALLDAEVPGWRSRIKLSTINLGIPERCVLAQVFGGYGAGTTRLWPDTPWHKRGERSSEHGFTLLYDQMPNRDESTANIDAAFQVLTNEWRQVLTERKDTVNA
jgi:hypothetical protein